MKKKAKLEQKARTTKSPMMLPEPWCNGFLSIFKILIPLPSKNKLWPNKEKSQWSKLIIGLLMPDKEQSKATSKERTDFIILHSN